MAIYPAFTGWADGGATRLDNLVRDATLHVIGTPPTWDGTRFDPPWAIDGLSRRRSGLLPA